MSRLFLVLFLGLLLTGSAFAVVSYTSNDCKIIGLEWEVTASGGCTIGTTIGFVTALCGTQNYMFTIPDANAQKLLMYYHALGTSSLRIYYDGGSCSTSGTTTDCRCNYGVKLYRINN